MTFAWEGLLLLDKPPGPTSHDIVDRIREITGERRIGHTGTLDPPATGLLVLVLGRATRLARFVPSAPKVYRGTLRLGVTTLTNDLDGAIVTRREAPPPPADRVVAAAGQFVGRSFQVPPAISARRVAGERLYRAARRGTPRVAAATPIDVDRFVLAPTEDASVWDFEVSVSAGTYVRGLARDLGEALGCGASVATLRRTEIGPLSVAAAVPWTPAAGPDSGCLAKGLVPIDRMPLATTWVILDREDERQLFLHGRAIPDRRNAPPTDFVSVRDALGSVLGIAWAEDGVLAPRTVLPQSDPPGDLPGPSRL